MKRIYAFTSSLVLCLLTAGCNPAEEPVSSTTGFKASLEPHRSEVRTTLDNLHLLWSAGDTISVFKAAGHPAGDHGVPFGLDPADDGKDVGHFESALYGEYVHTSCYALYPAAMDGGLSGSVLTVNLPSEQIWCKGSFAPNACPAVARGAGDGVLAFRNLCGLLALTVTADESIAEVRLTTLGEEALWGTGTVDMTYGEKPVLTMAAPADPAQKTLTVRVDENAPAGTGISVGNPIGAAGGTLSGDAARDSVFYFVVPAGTLAQGFMITVIAAGHKFMQKYAAASPQNTTERSVCTRMPGFAFIDCSEVEIRTDVLNKAYYKDLLMDTGIALSDYKTMPCTQRLGLTTETLYAPSNTSSNQTAQNRAFIGNANDENGILLYPDGEPRYKMMYVNGGLAANHGRSLMAEGREHFRTFVYNGGSYQGSCAGSFVATIGVIDSYHAHNGYLGIWPGYANNTTITDVYPDYTVPADSPLLNYDDFGGDFRIDSIMHWNGPYFAQYASVPGTEVLTRFDYPAYRFHTHPSIISYKPSPYSGRITLSGGHPEQYTTGEGVKLMDAMVRYSLDGRGIAKVKSVLRNGEVRRMTKSTSDGDPDHAKVGDRQCHNFVFALPDGARNIRVRLEVLADFNVSLRLAKGTFAFSGDADYAVENADPVKELSFATLEKGTWYIGVQCEDTVVNDPSSTNGISYSGKTAALNGAPYTIQVSWE